MVKIVLVDDHSIVRQGLAQLIMQEPDLVVCGEAEDEAGALKVVYAEKPDIVIVDLSLKSGNGIDLIKGIRNESPSTPILVLSMHDESHYVERALRAGAWGYLTKQEASSKVLTAIRQLLRGQVYLSDILSPDLLKRLLTTARNGEDPVVGRLSDRELQVFQLIAEGLGTQEIAERLHLSVKTIETHQAHIREKLDLKDARKLYQYAIRWGIGQDHK